MSRTTPRSAAVAPRGAGVAPHGAGIAPHGAGEVTELVRARYAAAATSLVGASDGRCCGPACCGPGPAESGPAESGPAESGPAESEETFGSALYAAADRAALPVAAVAASLGCGSPTAVADLRPGERVLDLGSGGGIDVLLSARRVGPGGFAYGVDMTEEMLDLARRNAAASGQTNVAFRQGTIEALPWPDASLDVVISNCVINLSTDKATVFAEAFRVLVPGGRLGISDIVAEDDLTPEQRLERGSWAGCIAGALSFEEYRAMLDAAGFVDVSVTPTHAVADGMHAATVRARKPA